MCKTGTLFISTLMPGSKTGGARRSAQIFSMLKNIGDVDLIYFKKDEGCFVSNFEAFPISKEAPFYYPFSVKRYFSNDLFDYIQKKQFDYNAIFIDHSHLLYLFKGLLITRFADLQNVESRYYHELGKCTKNPVYFLESFMFNFYEKSFLNRCNMIFSPSLKEKEYLSGYHHAVKYLRHSFGNFKELKEASQNRLILLGNLDFCPNRKGIELLYDNLKNTTHKVFISGAGKAINNNDVFTFLGEFEDISDILHRGDILLFPVIHGAGARVKILYSLQCTIPFITTKKGVEGYPENLYKCGIVVDSIDDFSNAIEKMKNKEVYNTFVDNIEKIKNDYSIKSILPSFKSNIKGVLKKDI